MSVPPTPARAPSFAEFVALVAVMIALTALSIDVMLVALPDIAASYGVTAANDRQLIITLYMAGFAVGQILSGPLSDRYGRRPVLFVGLAVMAVAALLAAFAPSFRLLLAARFLQGIGASAPRVLAVAVVRDRYAGREMSRVMSFAIMIFVVVPVLAPSLGGVVLHLGPWPWIFALMALGAVATLVWAALRLPETHPPERRVPLSATRLTGIVLEVVRCRRTLGYTVAAGFLFGGVLAYVSSAQQLFVDLYDLGPLFPLMFGGVAVVMGLASLVNSRLVMQLGMRRVSHVGLVLYLGVWLLGGVLGFPAQPPLPLLVLMLAAAFFFSGLAMPNCNALAMEPLGHVAGTASSFIGFFTSALAALVGWMVGQAFDGTVRPLLVGFAAVGVSALLAVLQTERGRLALFHTPADGTARG